MYRHDLSGRSRIACPDDSKNLQLSRQYMSDNFSQLVKSNPDRLPCLRLIPDSFIIGSLLFEPVGLLLHSAQSVCDLRKLTGKLFKKAPAGCSGAASESVACASASEADVSFGSVDCDSTSGILVVAEPRGSADCGSDASATVCVCGSFSRTGSRRTLAQRFYVHRQHFRSVRIQHIRIRVGAPTPSSCIRPGMPLFSFFPDRSFFRIN